MKLIAALVVAFFGFAGYAPAAATPVPTLAVALPDVQAAARAVEIELPAAEPEVTVDVAPLAEAVRLQRGRRVVKIPADCRRADGSFDVVIHYHGAPTTVEPAFERSGLKAVLVIVNLGIGSGPYENAYANDGSLERELNWVTKVVADKCAMNGVERKLGRVALSAWSAGYGAVYRALSHEGDSKLVDAVLLADGLHAGFENKWHNSLNALQMAPFDDFAAKAARGDKLFTITHSAIVTQTYASTTQTANYLVEQRGMTAEQVDETGPRDMQLKTRADKGGFHVRGYAGGDTDAHCDHLYALDATTFADLKAHWAK